MQGIARLHGVPRRQAAALKLKDLDPINTSIGKQPGRSAIRNRALLLLGFFGAFRRSELVSLTCEQVSFVSDGMIMKSSRSKTGQTGLGASMPAIQRHGRWRSTKTVVEYIEAVASLPIVLLMCCLGLAVNWLSVKTSHF